MPVNSRPDVRRCRIRVSGVVQGVGYRPFVCKAARSRGLAGWVLNDPRGVLIEVDGPPDEISRFCEELRESAPVLAKVTGVAVEAIPVSEPLPPTFEIRESDRAGQPITIVPPDSHVCDDCLREIYTPADRRYRYPFTNCTNCGPRYSLIRSLPYDRSQTTMAVFTMCGHCRREYSDPMDRRYHAQPNACPACGPKLSLADARGDLAEGDEALRRAAGALADGRIVAVKSVGGFHLAADARNGAAVAELRKRKRRDAKPFAIMTADVADATRVAEIGDHEAELMTSPARPIVLVRKRPGALPEQVAPRNPNLGVMLPSAPLHHLLLSGSGLDVLVMTSGNVSGRPIVFRDEDALTELFEVADLVLHHDRAIEVRVDDSVLRYSVHPELDEPLITFLRRSRGYAPYPVEVAEELPSVVAYGAELKTTVAVTDGDRVYLSQHIGDLKNDETFESHRRTVEHLTALHDLKPAYAACDLHPAFRSTRSALVEYEGRLLQVQHHHAHMASCMAENRLSGPTIGVVFDGAGYGPDGTIWGGEFLLGDYTAVRRVAHLRPVPLLGGDKAVHEPIRTGFALALDAVGDLAGAAFPVLARLTEDEQAVYARMARRGLNSPLTSSMGRLFDGVAALLDVCTHAEYEAHGPIELEGLLGRDVTMGEPYPFGRIERDGVIEVDTRPAVVRLAADLAAGAGPREMSLGFHSGVVAMVLARCEELRRAHGVDQVVLSGGVFLNEFVLVNCMVALRRAGFDAHCHRYVPTNDGGIALGQAMVAGAHFPRGSATGGDG
ncbi:carbamoyltransferase HypF [Actinomadura sp. 9N215]|uniref:carbamoyltransferase HypF n=1 Tax=Actinomadura sp. 9N215 TaxID=3375150 RepID=UPI003787A501